MDRWQFFFSRTAEDDLKRLDAGTRQRILEKLEWFVDHFDSVTPLPLGEPWKGFFKLRSGDWRIVYQVDHPEQRIVIHRIGRRDQIYRKRG